MEKSIKTFTFSELASGQYFNPVEEKFNEIPNFVVDIYNFIGSFQEVFNGTEKQLMKLMSIGCYYETDVIFFKYDANGRTFYKYMNRNGKTYYIVSKKDNNKLYSVLI